MEQVNGVFKGGGAKGIAYAGALLACEEAGLEFRAVAGSSAGAITAALVACGYDSREVTDLVPEALARLDSPTMASLKVWRSSLMATRRLEPWLDDVLRARVTASAGPAASPTFADLRRATGVTLYVIAMDLATGQPVVFSPDLTPSTTVVAAVMASSAIPVAFPPRRFRAGGMVRRFIDGGTWANYPTFVFLDADFRGHHALADGAEGRRTLGFVLDDRSDPPGLAGDLRAVPGRPLLDDRGSTAREFGPLGAIMTSPVARLLAILAPVAFWLMAFDWLHREVDAGFPVLSEIPDTIEFATLLVLLTLLALSSVAVLAVTAVALRFGHALPDVGAGGAVAAMGVGPSVPYWVGRSAGGGPASHLAIRIPVPDGLDTLTFRAGPELRSLAVTSGHDAAAHALLGRDEPCRLPPPAPLRSPGLPRRMGEWIRRNGRRLGDGAVSWLVLLGLVSASLQVVRTLATPTTVTVDVASTSITVGATVVVGSWLVLSVSAAGVFLWRLGRRRGQVAARLSGPEDRWSDARLRAVVVVAGLGCAIFGALALDAVRFSVIGFLNAEPVVADVVGAQGADDVRIDVADVVRGDVGTLRAANGLPMGPCGSTCVVMPGGAQYVADGQVLVRYDPGRHRLVLDATLWSPENWSVLPLALAFAIPTGSLALNAHRVSRRRRQLRTLDQADGG